jgi:hypothetical protein
MLDEETEQDKTVNMHSDSPNEPQSTTEGSQNSKHHGGGRTPRKVFRFHPHHPVYHGHAQVLKAKQHTLIFNM